MITGWTPSSNQPPPPLQRSSAALNYSSSDWLRLCGLDHSGAVLGSVPTPPQMGPVCFSAGPLMNAPGLKPTPDPPGRAVSQNWALIWICRRREQVRGGPAPAPQGLQGPQGLRVQGQVSGTPGHVGGSARPSFGASGSESNPFQQLLQPLCDWKSDVFLAFTFLFILSSRNRRRAETMAARRRSRFAGVVLTAVVVTMLLPGESANERLSLGNLKYSLLDPVKHRAQQLFQHLKYKCPRSKK